MDATRDTRNPTRPKPAEDRRTRTAGSSAEHVETRLLERFENTRDLVEDLRDRAEIVLHERPYLLPVAAGALGLGVGVLIGSRLSRALFFTTVGALLSDTVRGKIAAVSRELIRDLGERQGSEGSGDGSLRDHGASPSQRPAEH
jgi:hypothetical protein